MPEAGLHVLEAIVTGDVGEVEHRHVAGSLVAEGQTLLPRQCCGDAVAHAAGSVVSA